MITNGYKIRRRLFIYDTFSVGIDPLLLSFTSIAINYQALCIAAGMKILFVNRVKNTDRDFPRPITRERNSLIFLERFARQATMNNYINVDAFFFARHTNDSSILWGKIKIQLSLTHGSRERKDRYIKGRDAARSFSRAYFFQDEEMDGSCDERTAIEAAALPLYDHLPPTREHSAAACNKISAGTMRTRLRSRK